MSRVIPEIGVRLPSKKIVKLCKPQTSKLPMRPAPVLEEPVPPTLREGQPAPPRTRSDVVPRGTTLGATPFQAAPPEPPPFIVLALVRSAADQLRTGDRREALRMAGDALDILGRVKARAELEPGLVTLGELLVDLGVSPRALSPLEEALVLADLRADAAAGARARLALGRAQLDLGDAACRKTLEDAGEMFEELGDAASAQRVEALLRAAEACIVEESPRSFHATSISSLRTIGRR
jgi:hypothetical protein